MRDLLLMTYYRPTRLSDALNWLDANEAGIVAGCTDLFAATTSQRLEKKSFERLLDITAIEDLRTVDINADFIRLGAALSWSDITAMDLPPAFDALKAAGREVGSVQIQNSGTVGGNLCNASPAADGVPPLLILDAEVELMSKAGTRRMALSDFLQGPRLTAIGADEILSAIIVSNDKCDGVSSFIKLGARKYLVISIAMVAVRAIVAAGAISEIAISVGSCSATAVRLRSLEAALTGWRVGEELTTGVREELLAKDLTPIDDIRASGTYRLGAAHTLIVRAIEELIA